MFLGVPLHLVVKQYSPRTVIDHFLRHKINVHNVTPTFDDTFAVPRDALILHHLRLGSALACCV